MRALLKISREDGRIVIDFKNSIIISKYLNVDEYGISMEDIGDEKPDILITNAIVVGNRYGNSMKVSELISYFGYNKYLCKFIRVLLKFSDWINN